MDAAWFRLLLIKFPCLDLAWPRDVQALWWRAYEALWRALPPSDARKPSTRHGFRQAATRARIYDSTC